MAAPRVLLVDDETEFLNLMVKRLTLRGVEAEGVTSGQDALRALDRTAFDVVILDLKMPGMDGIETLKAIRNRQQPPEIIMVTGHGSLKTGGEALSHGAYDYVLKPFRLEELRDKIFKARERRLLAGGETHGL